MASTAPAGAIPGHIDGVASSPAEDEQLYTDLLRLQDAVIAGQHPQFKLSHSAIEQLKAALIVPGAGANSSAYAANQQRLPFAVPGSNGLPGLNGHAVAQTAPGGLNPIFLEKSDSLVRAEGQLKRQRLEREVQAQVDQRKPSARAGDPNTDSPSRLDVDGVLNAAVIQVTPSSGLRSEPAASVSSFDENDYYSSQAPDDWSSRASSSKGSDMGAGLVTTVDYDRRAVHPAPIAYPSASIAAESSASARKRAGLHDPAFPPVSRSYPHSYANESQDVYTVDDEDEYMPPDAAAFDSFREDPSTTDHRQVTPPEDDDSDYEPGEITQDSAVPTPQQVPGRAARISPRVPVIRNHLTHIAAPQPNRVSPLATANGSNVELELVNGRPEIVQKSKPQQRSYQIQSRASTASPPGNGAGSSSKKSRKKNNKRKREQERNDKSAKKSRRERAAVACSPVQQGPFIKDEPVSPPPLLTNVPDYGRPEDRRVPPQIDLSSPVHASRPLQYALDPPQSALRYEYAQPASPAVVRVASPTAYRPVQRDTQDLRRVASLHRAQRPPSPQDRMYSPVAPYRPISTVYPEQSHLQQVVPPPAPSPPIYQATNGGVQYLQTSRAPSPAGVDQYHRDHSRMPDNIAAAPPTARILQDQYGRRFYAPDPGLGRASVAPVDQTAEPVYERAPSRAFSYAQQAAQYEPIEPRMAPPPLPRKRQDHTVQYIDTNGYLVSDRSERLAPGQAAGYDNEPTSPVYQQTRQYEPMPPPPSRGEPTSPVYQQIPRYELVAPPSVAAPRGLTSPSYQPPSRAYSVRPEEAGHLTDDYVRQVSMAPAQYARQDMAPPAVPTRAASVMPGPASDYRQASQQPQPAYRYAPAPPAQVKYVDQYGQEVHPQQVRQVYR